MIVITKKKILAWISVLSVFIITLTIFNASVLKKETFQTVSLPASNKVIVLDAGHGKPDERSRK